MLRKNYDAHGAFLTRRSGSHWCRQLVVQDLCYGATHRDDRMMTYLRIIGLLPIFRLRTSTLSETAKQAIAMGAKALMVPSWCPQKHSPSHMVFVRLGYGQSRSAYLVSCGGRRKTKPNIQDQWFAGRPRLSRWRCQLHLRDISAYLHISPADEKR